jgi:hypothetical protein
MNSTKLRSIDMIKASEWTRHGGDLDWEEAMYERTVEANESLDLIYRTLEDLLTEIKAR